MPPRPPSRPGTKNGPVSVSPPGGVTYEPDAFGRAASDRYFRLLQERVAWKQERIAIFGRDVAMPRLTAWYGDVGASYTYSGLRNDPSPWTPELSELRDAVAARLRHRFNSVLLNRYRSGRDGVSWHSDDEPELGDEPVIASLSFGATRRFLLRDRSTRERAASLELEHGSLLVMRGRSQRVFQHCVPKDPRATGERINLTFRTILPDR